MQIQFHLELLWSNQLSEDLINTLLISEDHRFHEHSGLDFQAFIRVFYVVVTFDVSAKGGGSTLTQQLAKNTFLNPSRSYWRKLQEVRLARKIEKRYSKSQILEAYVNRIYWGSGFYGVEEASQGYFGKPASQLNLSESYLVATGMPLSRCNGAR